MTFAKAKHSGQAPFVFPDLVLPFLSRYWVPEMRQRNRFPVDRK